MAVLRIGATVRVFHQTTRFDGLLRFIGVKGDKALFARFDDLDEEPLRKGAHHFLISKIKVWTMATEEVEGEERSVWRAAILPT